MKLLINKTIKTFFIYFVIVSSIAFAQSNNIKEIDSLRLEQKYQHLLGIDSKNVIPLYTLDEVLDPYGLPFETDFLNHANGNILELNSFTMQKIKNNMNQSFSVFRQGQKKYHLGVVSDVLGYVQAAAVAGLAIYHVAKNKKMYGIR